MLQAALEATGKGFKSKKIDYMMEKASTSSPKVPKLPTRESKSPTGRRRTKVGVVLDSYCYVS